MGLVLPEVIFQDLFTEGESRCNLLLILSVMITEMTDLDGTKITEKLW